ncbi:MAG: hypothetical protein C0621_06165 [Desulfuromonas sp.]|nr:MAG: hypothetical protein C0621_06165 [Desulfuromonas sp.]
MSTYFIFSLMLVAGMMVAVQPSINARLAQHVGLIESAALSFAVGTVALLIVSFVTSRGDWRGVSQTTWWEWSGGLFGAVYVAASIFAVPRIGTAATMAAVIASQLATGLLMDHFGLFGFHGAPFDGKRLLGVILLMLGAFLVVRR